jgi:hypothetical protein
MKAYLVTTATLQEPELSRNLAAVAGILAVREGFRFTDSPYIGHLTRTDNGP